MSSVLSKEGDILRMTGSELLCGMKQYINQIGRDEKKWKFSKTVSLCIKMDAPFCRLGTGSRHIIN